MIACAGGTFTATPAMGWLPGCRDALKVSPQKGNCLHERGELTGILVRALFIMSGVDPSPDTIENIMNKTAELIQ